MAITTEQRTQLIELYVAIAGRAPDASGLSYWANEMETKGYSIAEIAAFMYDTDDAKALYPRYLTSEEVATAFYENVLGRTPDAEGLAYWTAKLNENGVVQTMQDMIYAVKVYDGEDPAGLTSKQLFADKLALSEQLAVVRQSDDLSVASTSFEQLEAGVSLEDVLANLGSGSEFTLTNGTDVATANVFESGLVYTPGGDDRINSLQDEDRLTGTGTNPTLNADLGNANDNGATTITPELNGIDTLNLKFTGSSAAFAVNQLDLQDATGLANAININRISDGVGVGAAVIIDNIGTLSENLRVANSGQVGQSVNFAFTDAAVAGADDSVNLEVSNVNVARLTVEERGVADQGIETINLMSNGSSNTLGAFQAEDLQTLNISGDQDLTIGSTATTFRAGTTTAEATQYAAGFANVAGSLTAINAADLTGDLTLHLGGELNAGLDNTSGLQAEVAVTGGAGNDTFVLTNGAVIGGATGNTDTIAGGEGTNTILMVGNSTINAAATPNVTNVQALEIRTGHDLEATVAAAVADIVTIDADAFDALESIFVRNEGMATDGGDVDTDGNNTEVLSAAEGMTVNLNDLTAEQAQAITLAHGTTGNSNIANNILNVRSKTDTATNAVQVTLVDGVNNNPVFNAQINAVDAELVTIVDNDTESNTVHLADAARTQAGSTLTVQGGADSDAGNYMNFDSFSGLSAPAIVGGADGYGYATDGSAGSNTTAVAAAAAILGVDAAVSSSQRDNEVSSVFYGTAGTAVDGATRHTFENIDASSYEGDLVIRLGDVTRADGVTSMNIQSGSGNDTFIFDAIGVTDAGFTSADTIAASTGTDTLVLDGNTATIPGTPRIDHQTSEWDNLTGIDVLRYGNNAGVTNVGNNAQVANNGGAYYTRIDNDFISQTDNGDRLTVINNDGDLLRNTESDLVLDLRGLSQNKWVTFQGANGTGVAGLSSNRLVLDDVSANQNMILDGGDTDVRVNTTATYVAGNNNVLEVNNTANVSVSDLSQMSNFGLINFTNDQATAQTLTLTLNNTVVEALVDSSSTATTAATQEVLNIIANDNIVAGTASVLNIDARQVSGFHAVNVTGSAAGSDVLTLNSNLGGTSNVVDLQAGATDRVNWVGTATNVRIELGTWTDAGVIGTAEAGEGGVAIFQTGAVTTGHVMQNVEVVDLTGMTYTNATVIGAAVAETIIGGAGNDIITGGAGADTLTGNGGNDVFTYTAVAESNSAAYDTITDLNIDADQIDLNVVVASVNGTVTGTVSTATLVADLNTLLSVAGNGFNTTAAGDISAALVTANAGTLNGRTFLAVDADNDDAFTVADYLIDVTGITGTLQVADFI